MNTTIYTVMRTKPTDYDDILHHVLLFENLNTSTCCIIIYLFNDMSNSIHYEYNSRRLLQMTMIYSIYIYRIYMHVYMYVLQLYTPP